MNRRPMSLFTKTHGRLALRSGMAGFALAACTLAGLQLHAQAIAGHNSNAPVEYAANRIELQDREFIAAIREGREPNSSLRQVIDCYRVLGQLEEQLA